MPLYNPISDISYPLSGLTLDGPSTNCLAKLVALGAVTVINPYATLVAKLDAVGVKVYDSFDRANSALTIGNADTGEAWTSTTGTWGINNNTAYLAVSSGAVVDRAILDSGVSDSSISIVATVDGGTNTIRVVGRYTDDLNEIFVNRTVSGYEMLKRVAGTITSLGIYATTPQNGDALKLEMDGTILKLYLNDILRISVTESFNSTATKCGIATLGVTGARINNFIVEDI